MLARHFRSLVEISREDIFGLSDEGHRPLNLPQDAATMFAGYIGSAYCPGGVVVLAINPGGGGDTYCQRTVEDDEVYPLLHTFKLSEGTAVLSAFESINTAFARIVQQWNLWRVLGPTLEATGRSIDQFAYMNVVPYRTRENKTPPVDAQRTAWAKIVAPTLHLLTPAVIITLGKKARTVVSRWNQNSLPCYCVPRTIGDTYLSAEALQVLRSIREDFARDGAGVP